MLGAILGGASVLSGKLSADAAVEAAEKQAAAARYATDVQKQMFDIQQRKAEPWTGAGRVGLNEILRLTGGASTPQYDPLTGAVTGLTTGTQYFTTPYTAEEFKKGMDPGYQFRLQQGIDLARRQGNVGGGLVGGNVMKGLEDYAQQSASQEFSNAFNRSQTEKTNIYNRLASLAGLGQASQQQTADLAAKTAGNIGNYAIGAGNAAAAGTVGAANALGGGLQGGAQGYTLGSLLTPASRGSTYTPQAASYYQTQYAGLPYTGEMGLVY